ncbi:IS3 family transposase [Limnoglobus roseus]|uniref:IS3 family transposase n=1 Tax=Limnoglobus roseus TaxID=2598579 RepID=A0A5C1AIM0_9BACT|nr:IS3 family transposase [Limnoglobus roseus]QEL16818.1 IS3 family transposase [Limnoglobus roseus]
MIFAWIEERRSDYPVAALCRALGVSRSGFYARANRRPSATAVRREALVAHIRAVHAEVRGRYGSPRLARELKARGVACCVNTVAKAMAAHGLRAKAVKRFVRTTDSGHRLPVSENVLARDFAAARPNEKWAMDLTYVPTLEGWLFLALVVDLFSRRIVGWAMAAAMTSRLVVDALDLAVGRRGVPPGLIAHSDRGSQYASAHYQAELRRHGMVGSMSGVGQCWDNAVVESTFGRLKQELVHGERYATRDEARASIFEYVEVFYNRVRRHSTLGYVSPAEYERAHDPNNR